MRTRKIYWPVLALALGLWPAAAILAAGAEPVTQEEVRADAERYQALGAAYSAQGFAEFPDRDTPFHGGIGYGWHKLTQDRLRGSLVYVDPVGGEIGHSFACGRRGTVYLELWLPGGEKGVIPFAWQDLSLTCRNGGRPSGENPLYLDITGDGKPEVKFAAVDQVSSETIADGVRRRVFKEAIIPAWVKKLPGQSGQGSVQPGPLWIEPYDGIRRTEP